MNKDKQDIDLIKQYFRGQLSPSEMHRLEKRALDDPFFAEAMEGYEHFLNNSHSLNELKVRLKSRVNSKLPKSPSEQPINYKIWSIAACAVILIGLLSIYLNQPKENDFSESLANSNLRSNTVPQDTSLFKESPPASAVQESELTDAISKSDIIVSNKAKSRESGDSIVASDIIVEQIKKSAMAPAVATMAEPAAIAKTEKLTETDIITSLSQPNTKTAKAADSTATKGKISDLSTAKPIAGATVRDSKTNIRVVTNENGEFFFPYKVSRIAIYATGFQNREIDLGPLQEININLNPNQQPEYQIKNIKRGTLVGPYNGWPAFRKYLNENSELESGETGHVIVEFTIKPNGELSNFKILKSLSKLADARAIDLIKNYQYWQGSLDGYSNRIKITVRFR